MNKQEIIIHSNLDIAELKGNLEKIELPKKKVSLEDLEQKLLNHLYRLSPNNYDQNDIKMLEILFYKKD